MKRLEGTEGGGHGGATEATQTDVLDYLREELDHTRSELEASKDELHSTVQELQATAAELRSTTDTLEKVTAELESTTGDVRAIDQELRQRSIEIDESNTFVAGVLDSLDHAVIVVRPDLRVRTWNHRAQELWGLRARDAIDRPLLSLDIGLPVAELEAPLGTTFTEPGADHSFELDGSSSQNGSSRYSVRCLPLRSNDGEIAGATIVVAPQADPA